jgi:hypothetical protein
MKTQDIKNMGQALQQVQESSKAALAKKLAKASQSSDKGKAAVTLPKAPFEIPKKDANEALKGDQHKLDHDKDGDIDAADFKGLRKKKKSDKAEVKPRQETETDKGKEAPMEKTESTRWPVYARIMEKKSHTAGATPPEEMDSKDSPTAKKMKADHKPEVNDTEAKGHQDAADAGRKGPNGQARPNDQQKGDKKIVNPVQGAVTSGSN